MRRVVVLVARARQEAPIRQLPVLQQEIASVLLAPYVLLELGVLQCAQLPLIQDV